MKKKKIAIVVGVRPHFVKLAAIYPYLVKEHQVKIIHTGQHFDNEMSKVFFDQLSIPDPDFRLNMGSGIHTEQVGRGILDIGYVLNDCRPDCVIVFGDANSSLAGAVAAAKLGLSIAHIEAGARNHDMKLPEEVNRLIIDSVSTFFFCPTEAAGISLGHRGVTQNLFVTGDLLLDSVKKNIETARRKSNILEELGLRSKDYYVLTIHRADNTIEPFAINLIIDTLLETGENVVFPVHPRTRKFLQQTGLEQKILSSSRFILTSPVSYFDILALIENSKLVISDSNGIQREAYFLRRPCVILRDSTEFPETVISGGALMCNLQKDQFQRSLRAENFLSAVFDETRFGDGNSAIKISSILREKL